MLGFCRPPPRRPRSRQPLGMDAAEVAAKVCALEAKLAATSPRIADLETRVLLLEAENARWRKAVPRGGTSGRLEEGLSGSKQETAQKVGASFNEVGDSDGKGMDADVSNWRSSDDGVLALSTPKKLAVWALTGGRHDGDEIDDAGGGGGGPGGHHLGVHCDSNVSLEDDDVLITPCRKKRARMIASDSEDEDENGKDSEMQEGGVTPSRKRVFRGLGGDSDNEDNSDGVHLVSLEHVSCVAEARNENEEDDEDDRKPIREVVKKMRDERMRLDDAELGDTEERSMPAKRRSARLVEIQSKKAQFARQVHDLVEHKAYEEGQDDLEENGMNESTDDADFSENSTYSAEPENSDSEMDCTLLKHVTQESRCWRIRVRITRVSRYMSQDQPLTVLQLNFVMLDEQGGMMEGQIPTRLLPIFLPLIREDVVYCIHYFDVINSRPAYRAVDHPYKAKFVRYSKISEDTFVPDSFPMYAYALSSYEVLRSRESDTVLMSDVIGLMMGVSHVRTVHVKGAPTAIRNVYISNGRETAVVVLWGAHALQFPAEALQQQKQHGPVVIVFVGLTAKLYEGKLSLQGSKCCMWYLDVPIPEAIALQKSSAGAQTVRVSVGDIWDLNPHETLGNAYDVDIAIKSLLPDEPWWYMGCQGCKRTIFQSGDRFRCSNCGGTVEEIRYRLALLGLDPLRMHDKEPKAAEFVFFGDIGEQLTGVSALTLIATGQGITDYIPHEITSLYGRHYNLKVKVSPGSLQRESISYQVYSLTALPALSTMPLREIEKNTTPPIASVGTHDRISSQGTGSTNVEKENDGLQLVEMGITSEQASQAMAAAAATA